MPTGGMPRVEVRVADDAMVAEARAAHVSPAATADDLRAALAATGVVYGLDDAAIAGAVASPGAWIVVARGAPPTEPEDGTVEILVEAARGPRLAEDDRGRVDFKDLGLIANVRAGDAVARRRPPRPGAPGTDVRGRAIEPRPPRLEAIRAGRNVEVSSDGAEARAAKAGKVEVDRDGRITVETVHRVAGDVGPATGNVEFLGEEVAVDADLLDGYEVKCAGSVRVAGSVQAARIEAGGSIRVAGGVVGRGRAVLVAGGDIDLRFAEDARIVAGGRLTVRESLLRCVSIAGGTVRVEGRGAIVGGSVSAQGGLAASVVGSEAGIRTLLEAGISAEARRRLDEVEAEFVAARRRVLEISREVGPLETDRASGRLSPERLARLDALIAERETLRRRLATLAIEARAAAAHAAAPAPALVKVSEGAFPGVVIASLETVVPVRERSGRIALQAVAGRLEKAAP